MRPKTNTHLARIAGALIGVALAALVLIGARPGAGPVDPVGSIRMSVPPTGELEVGPARGPVLAASSLRPGEPQAEGSFTVRNQTGGTLAVAFRAEGGSTALDGALRVRVESSGTILADDTLQGLRAGSGSIAVASGASAKVQIESWIPAAIAGGGFLGGATDVTLAPVLGGSQ